MEVITRTRYLNQLFSYEHKTEIADSKLEIIPFRFTQTIGSGEIESFQKELPSTDFCSLSDNHIEENKSLHIRFLIRRVGRNRTKLSFYYMD